MRISEYAVKHPQVTILLFLMIIVVGVSTLITIPRSEDPELSSPEFPVIVIYPGTSPKDLEELVVDPLEQKLSSLEGVKQVVSNISDGIAFTLVRYKHGYDVDEKFQEVVREANGMRSDLPPDIYSLEVRKWLPSNVNVIQAAVISENAPMEKLEYHAKKFKDELEKLPQLKNVKIFGLPDKTVRVELKLDKLNGMRVPLEAVLGSIQSEAVNIPGGSVDVGSKVFNIQTSGNYSSIDEIKNTIVYSAMGRNVLLKDVADVYPDYDRRKHIARLDTYRCLFVVAAQKPGENITASQQVYLPAIQKFRESLPENIDLVHHFDQADNVNKRLAGLGLDFLIAIGLVAITLLPLGGRAAIIVMISIPLSLSMGVVMIQFLGFNLNQLSIVGFVVALGLLVDDSIVVVENIERWLREGYSRTEAAIRATKQIGLAVVGCTATLIVAFMPLVFLPGASGDFIRSLPMGVITSVLASMIVSLTFIPFLSNYILKEQAGHPEGNMFLRALKKIIHGSYARILDKALKNPLPALVIALIIFAASLGLFPVIGFSLFPVSEKPQFLVDIITPLQSNLEYTDSVTKQIENELNAIPEVQHFATNVGRGNPQIYYNVFPENERSDYAQIFVQLKGNTSSARKLAIIDTLRKRWTPYLGAKIEVKNFEQGPPVDAPVEVRLLGDNLDTLRVLAARVEDLVKNIEGTIYVKNPLSNLKSDIEVKINKSKASMLGVPTINIDKTVRMAVAGLELGKMTDSEGENYKILATKKKADIHSLEAFNNLHVNSVMGTAVPLSQVAELKLVSSPVTINHLNKTRTVSVSSFVKKGYLNDNVIRDVEEKMSSLALPAGYSYEFGGEVEQREESFGGFSNVIIATVFLFVLILILEFKTFKSTIIVLSVIPLGIVGAVIALLITGNSLSFVAIIGLIALAGVEVKNTILLVDFTNQLRQNGMGIEEAVREAGEVRFLPIILTSMTAIGGLLPIALSVNPMISPLAIVLIGGLISSTLLSRIVTPVVYKLIPPKI
ncbi:MAG: efflux RND transporter permease subunit [Ignavibacteriaceae bacterium]|nr:efflux RND transporter permease subunit [Ignavibacteriaceae bacterium]